MRQRSIVCLLVLCVMLMLSGCAQNSIPLVYTPVGPEVIPAAGAPTLSVVIFDDNRNTLEIGKRSDGTAFTPASNVSDWMTRSLAAELTRLGYIVTIAPTEAAAKAAGVKYILTGRVNEVWLTEHSSASYASSMSATISLSGAKGSVFKHTFNSSISRKVIPMPDAPKDIMAETISDLVRPISLFVQQKTAL